MDQEQDYYKLSTRNLACKIPHAEIVYFNSKKMKTTLHTLSGEKYTVSKNLSRVYDEICRPKMFIKIDRSIVINLVHVKCYEKDNGRTVVMKNNHALSVSRREKSKMLKAYFS